MSRQIHAVCLKCLFSLVLLVSIGLPALGQSASSAAVNGIVQDTTDARIPNASVKLINTDTGTESNFTTGKDGNFSIPSVLPGHYRLQIERDGFDTTQLTGITLNVGDNKNVIIRMKVGSPQQTVTVDASSLTMNTTDGSVSTVIDRNFVANIPLNGRSFQDLILLTPGVVTQSPQSAQGLGADGDFSVNGQRTESNYYSVDGVVANTNPGLSGAPGNASSGSVPSSTALGTTQSLVSVDALQEFRVNSSTYSAEYGRTPGGQFSFVTRSGTDELHGSAYDYLRNNYFDANDWFNNYYNTPEAALRQNDFGGTFGGPIIVPHIYSGKGKTFFFVSYEGLRLTQPQPAVLEYVPSLSLRQNPNLPAAMQPILNAFPLPTPGGTDYGNGLAQFIQSDSLPSQINSTSVRVDHALSAQVKLFFRFGNTPSTSANRSLSEYTQTTSSNRTYTLGAALQLSHKVSDEVRLGYVDGSHTSRAALDSFGGAQPTNLAEALGAGTSPEAEGFFSLSTSGSDATSISTASQTNQLKQWNLTDALTWLLGRHQVKLGIDYRRIASSFSPSSPLAEYLYSSESQVLSNSALLAAGNVLLGGKPTYNEFSAFVQDEWHPIPRLTLSLGLRWELNPPPGAADAKLPYVLEGDIANPMTLSLAPEGTPLWKTTWFNLAPRLGAAWIANDTSGHQTVVRAGGGVFFDTGNEDASYGYGGVGFNAFELIFGAAAPFPGGINSSTIPISVAPPYTSTSVYYFYPHLQLPYTLEWSAAVEQALGKSQTLTITYVGSNGRRLLAVRQLDINSQNQDFGDIAQFTNGTTSNYQALQVKFQRTVAHGVQALASYSWSHSIDYGSNYQTLPYVRGNADFDLRNNFTLGATWQIPGVHPDRAFGKVLNGWALDAHVIARSAFPVTLNGNQLTDPSNGNIYYGQLNVVPNQPIYLHVSGIPGNREINASAFSLPTGNGTGNAPRNFVRGFSATQTNLAARREVRFTDKLTLQFRAEAFNILNHPNFGLIDAYLGDTTFGQATQTLNQSLTTVSPLYQMGGPRSMQFALKLQF